MRDMYYEKYLKYKNKYLNLKNTSLQGGNNLSNLKNALVMGAGPIGLITTLALLTRYSKKNNSKTGSQFIDCNNIFLTEIQNPTRPQVFFFQNSFRDYDSMDFIRDIDLETFQNIEKISCYIGSPPSTVTPYCFSPASNEDQPAPEIQTAMSRPNSKIRAPKNIPLDQEFNDNLEARNNFDPNDKLYMMNLLSFHVSDLETVLLDNIIRINNDNINFYISLESRLTPEQRISLQSKIDKIQINGNICNINLLKALFIKNYLIKIQNITLEEFKPLLILIHPYNGYCDVNSYIYMTMIINTAPQTLTDSTIKPVYSRDNNIIKHTEDGKIILNDIPIINSLDYDIVFESEAINKQFGNKDDYWIIKNRDNMTFDDKNKVKLDNNLFIPVILDKHTIIQIKENNPSNSQTKIENIYIIQNIQYNKLESIGIQIIVTLYRLAPNINSDPTDLNNYKLINTDRRELIFTLSYNPNSADRMSEIYRDIINYFTIENIIKVSDYTLKLKKPQRLPYNTPPSPPINQNDEDAMKKFKSNYTIYLGQYLNQFHYDLLEYMNNTQCTNGNSNITNDMEIYKINSLMVEETKVNLSEQTSKINAENSLVSAIVLLYETTDDLGGIINEMNDMYYDKQTFFNISGVPLTIDHGMGETENMNLGTFSDYKNKFNKVKNIRNRIDYGSLINQIYINNDQVQYFNDKMYLTGKKKHIHRHHGSAFVQHAFRVFGVNKNNSKIYNKVIKTDKLKDFMKITSTKPFYYCGIQISSDVTKLWRYFIGKDNIQKFITFHLFILGYLFTHIDNFAYDEESLLELINDIKSIWDRTYGNKPPETLEEKSNNPIKGLYAPIFPITLKYKENVIEEDKKINKTIFNMGDSGATVNFFSGTGLNTGVSNIKNILENYKIDKTNTTNLNEMIRIKNRRTIYNSLSSSQNPSVLSGVRNFQYGNEKLGFFKNNRDTLEINNQFEPDMFDNQVQSLNTMTIKIYYDNFDTAFTNTFTEFFKQQPSGITDVEKNQIKNILKVNVGYCLLNIGTPPVLSPFIDYKDESKTYAHHLHYNHFDTCNFMTGNNKENNKPYFCDLLGDKPDFDPRRITQINRSSNYTT